MKWEPVITFHIKSTTLKAEEIKEVLEEIKKSGIISCEKLTFEINLG